MPQRRYFYLVTQLGFGFSSEAEFFRNLHYLQKWLTSTCPTTEFCLLYFLSGLNLEPLSPLATLYGESGGQKVSLRVLIG